MIRAIDHINIVVSDLERSVKFYTDLLGFKEINRVHLEGEWIEEIVGLKGVSADVVFIVAPEALREHIAIVGVSQDGGNRSPRLPLKHVVGY